MTDISELEGLRTLISNVKIYIEDAQKIAVHMKGIALMNNNTSMYTSTQGGIDILLDLQSILDGKEIPSLKDIEMNVKKEEDQKRNEDSKYIY